ncbi:MAG: hypothetical protein ACE5KE_11020 [Methanosarcinales archaeon]
MENDNIIVEKYIHQLKGLSNNESELLQKLYSLDKTLFTSSDIARIINKKKESVYQITYNLKQKGWIREIEKGKYYIKNLNGYDIAINEPYVLATNIVFPSYLSFWSSLHFYGFTEQIPQKVLVATTKNKKNIELNGLYIQFIQIAKKRLFGYKKMRSNNLEFFVAEKEKAILDSLYLPQYAGGLSEVSKVIFNAIDEIDMDLLVYYALKMCNKSLVKRLGYLLELLEIDDTLQLEKNIDGGYSLLDPSKPKQSNYNKKWKLIVNISPQDLLYWRELY